MNGLSIRTEYFETVLFFEYAFSYDLPPNIDLISKIFCYFPELFCYFPKPYLSYKFFISKPF